MRALPIGDDPSGAHHYVLIARSRYARPKEAATLLLLVDTLRSPAQGMDGIYSAAREVDEQAELFDGGASLGETRGGRANCPGKRWRYAERAITKARGSRPLQHPALDRVRFPCVASPRPRDTILAPICTCSVYGLCSQSEDGTAMADRRVGRIAQVRGAPAAELTSPASPAPSESKALRLLAFLRQSNAVLWMRFLQARRTRKAISAFRAWQNSVAKESIYGSMRLPA